MAALTVNIRGPHAVGVRLAFGDSDVHVRYHSGVGQFSFADRKYDSADSVKLQLGQAVKHSTIVTPVWTRPANVARLVCGFSLVAYANAANCY